MATAIISMRANPPHLGHIRTLLRIKDQYDKIIIAITSSTHCGTKTQVMSTDEVMSIFREIFEKHFPEIYKVVYNEYDFCTRTTFDDLPGFDVIVTGNPESYQHMKKLGKNVVWIPRTPGYRGEYIREAYIKEKERVKHGDTDKKPE